MIKTPYPIITISGTPGSGKSTIAKSVVKHLQAQRIYVGGIRRDLAKQKNMTLVELNEYALTHPETDVNVDKTAAKKARELAQSSPVVVEGRTQFYFLPESIKLYIKADLKEGAKRVWLSIQNTEEKKLRNEAQINSLEELTEKIINREKNDLLRYQKYYQLDHTDESHYDFILDTSQIDAQTAIQKTMDFIDQAISRLKS